MQRLHIIGGKNHGKTTLVVELVREFRTRGIRVGTIKHTHHHHELDTPGKDSHRHRESGAAMVGILSPAMNAVFWPNAHAERDDQAPVPSDPRYARFAPMFSECEIVLVEGDSQTSALKLEVWRAALETRPIADRDPNVRAIVTDDTITHDLPTLRRADVPAIADYIVGILDGIDGDKLSSSERPPP